MDHIHSVFSGLMYIRQRINVVFHFLYIWNICWETEEAQDAIISLMAIQWRNIWLACFHEFVMIKTSFLKWGKEHIYFDKNNIYAKNKQHSMKNQWCIAENIKLACASVSIIQERESSRSKLWLNKWISVARKNCRNSYKSVALGVHNNTRVRISSV